MFYKLIDNELTYGPFVTLPDGVSLSIDTMGEVELPYEGWHYFETEQEAKTFFGITDEVQP